MCLVPMEVRRVTGCSETGVCYEAPYVLGIECRCSAKAASALNAEQSFQPQDYFRKLFVEEQISVFLYSLIFFSFLSLGFAV